ncbi:hypothetical protein [Actinoplanes sp. NPDC049118]|uniref:hypothetical protein n=1 Tax=Actinoplanes sp. NPDC049118 TaxID=3155769 RepID=UPI0033E942C7
MSAPQSPRELREEILRKHARTGPNGNVSRCYPPPGRSGAAKVIFRTKGAAERAEKELTERTETLHMRPYPCSHADHWHLSKMGATS